MLRMYEFACQIIDSIPVEILFLRHRVITDQRFIIPDMVTSVQNNVYVQ